MSDYSSEYMKPSIVMDSEGEEVRPDVAIPVWVELEVGIYNVAGNQNALGNANFGANTNITLNYNANFYENTNVWNK